MIPTDIIPSERHFIKAQIQKRFWKSCEILDHFNHGPVTIVIGRVKYSPDDEEARVWSSPLGIRPEEEPEYIDKFENNTPAALRLFGDILHNVVDSPSVFIRPKQNEARITISKLSSEDLLNPKEDKTIIDELAEKKKENFLENAVKYDFVSDFTKTYVVGYVGDSPEDPKSEWRIWVTEFSPTSKEATFLHKGLGKDRALEKFKAIIEAEGLTHNDFTKETKKSWEIYSHK